MPQSRVFPGRWRPERSGACASSTGKARRRRELTIDGSKEISRRSGDHKVDPPKLRDRLLDRRLEGLELPNVGLDPDTLPAGRLGELSGGLLDVGFAPSEDDSVAAV